MPHVACLRTRGSSYVSKVVYFVAGAVVRAGQHGEEAQPTAEFGERESPRRRATDSWKRLLGLTDTCYMLHVQIYILYMH